MLALYPRTGVLHTLASDTRKTVCERYTVNLVLLNRGARETYVMAGVKHGVFTMCVSCIEKELESMLG